MSSCVLCLNDDKETLFATIFFYKFDEFRMKNTCCENATFQINFFGSVLDHKYHRIIQQPTILMDLMNNTGDKVPGWPVHSSLHLKRIKRSYIYKFNRSVNLGT